VPEILVVTPPPMLDDLHEWSGVFEGAPETSGKLALEFEIQADSKEVHFFDAASVCACDPADGFHLSAEAHRQLGLALAAEVMAMGWPAE
jgi:lysophospholipase L1-like esterase